ncbi:MAG: hypothetical protein ACOX21_00500 [Bacillota bacterium]|jgi:hypothetical protein
MKFNEVDEVVEKREVKRPYDTEGDKIPYEIFSAIERDDIDSLKKLRQELIDFSKIEGDAESEGRENRQYVKVLKRNFTRRRGNGE